MAEEAFIYVDDLSSDTAQCLHKGQSSTNLFESTFEDISTAVKLQDVILIINGKNVYTSSVTLPNANLNQIQKAAPFALEDELAEDIEQLHFAFGKLVKNESVAVAVINKNLFQNLIAKLKKLNIHVTACYVDYLLLPQIESHWSIVNFNNFALVKKSLNSGFSVPQHQLEDLLKIQITALKYPPEAFDIYEMELKADTTVLAGIPVQTHPTTAKNLLSFLVNQIKEDFKGINLLQGSFKTTKRFDRAKKTWQLAAACFAAWLLVNGISTISNYFYYSYKEKQLTAQVNKIYKQVFPASTTIVSPKIRIERELKKYQRASSDGGFISLVNKVGPIIKQASNVKVENFGFQNQRGTLTISTNTFQNLQSFSDSLNKTGLPIQQTDAKSENKGVVASFDITMPES